ncbi:putative C6 transcription factor [Aspergillus mulundensis]|uniref:Putative C6 transcription factor n=1 Tax=Aspergillus mulundensis TaxID=1810919 RepID=A0A3D8S6S8_9EURO|nr:putative C6 transcription factor [Aspergillus mulundensis]RDW81771.1 putative C6 transcription factor [Aspergillus mulundensis]
MEFSARPSPRTVNKEADVSKRSCTRCNQKKLGCDRNHPCGRCLKAGAECLYPGNKRAPRKLKRPPISEIIDQLGELQEEVERLRSASGVPSAEPVGHSPQPGHGIDHHGRIEWQETAKGRLVVSGGRSWYVGDEASVILGDKIQELRELCDGHSDEESMAHASSPSTKPMTLVATKGFDQTANPNVDNNRYLQLPRIQTLWRIYQENVAPMIAILHVPSISAKLGESCAESESELEPGYKALLLAVGFAAVVSMTTQQCLSVLGEDHDACIHEYRVVAEQALAEANLVSTTDMQVLQAAVLFLLCLRRCADLQLIWAQAAIVVRVAQRQGLHRDGQQLGLAPFETEMRRRLWWHICILDMLCSEDQGTDTQIWPGMFDTKLPTNIDCNDLTQNMPSLPLPQKGYTDIALCIIQCEIMPVLHWFGKYVGHNAQQASSSEKEELLSHLANRFETEYLHNLDFDNPIEWLTAVIVRLTLSKAWLVHRISTSTAHQGPDAAAANDEIFTMAIEIVKFAMLLESNKTTTQWAWLAGTYKQRHVVAFILSELCERQITPETDYAWGVVRQLYDKWVREGTPSNAMLQEPLKRLMERAARSRDQKTH